MIRRSKNIAAALMALIMLICVSGLAEGVISTTVVLRVSRMTQHAVVDAGEDLSIEVNVDGITPAYYQWYFNDEKLPDANQRMYNIVNAQLEDAGIYRLDAFDENGKMLLSMDMAARVIDDSVPKSGDNSLPVGIAFAALALALGVFVVMLRKRATA